MTLGHRHGWDWCHVETGETAVLWKDMLGGVDGVKVFGAT